MADGGGGTPRVFCFATQGSGHGDERRIVALTRGVGAELLPFDRASKARSALKLLGTLLRERPDLVVMEGTGLAGGAALLAARALGGVPYVVSSGDAVGPYVKLGHPRLARVAAAYERLLCRYSAGFIGWTPYLAGRALTFGAKRAMTAAGWSDPARPQDRERRRRELGVPEGALAFGLVGTLDWTSGIEYCYGRELVDAVLRTDRADVCAVVIGDGSGLERLRELAGPELGRRVIMPGRVPADQVTSYLAALDVASLPQSVDGVGSFRYTTKISEYVAAGLPVVTSEIPLSYDLDGGWIWRLPGEAPWDRRYVGALAELMEALGREELEEKRQAVPAAPALFDRERQELQATRFLNALTDASAAAARPA